MAISSISDCIVYSMWKGWSSAFLRKRACFIIITAQVVHFSDCCSSVSQTRQEIEISAVPPETASKVSHRTTPKVKFTLVLKTKQFSWYSWIFWHFRKDLEGLGATFVILWKSSPRDQLTSPLRWNRTKQILTERAGYLLLCRVLKARV